MSKGEEEKSLDKQIGFRKRVVIEGTNVYIVIKSDKGEDVKIEMKKPKIADRKISGNEIMALNVMKLVIPLAFPDETSGVDDEAFNVEREADISNLPLRREANYVDALTWAGGILQAKGWPAQKVVSVLLEGLPANSKFAIGDLDNETRSVIEERLREQVVSFYPGSSIRKRT